MASAGTEVPSGSFEVEAELFAVALELTRLAVHTPESSARGTRVIALLRRDNGLVLICALPWSLDVSRPPRAVPTRP
jgi:hypothetical protein